MTDHVPEFQTVTIRTKAEEREQVLREAEAEAEVRRRERAIRDDIAIFTLTISQVMGIPLVFNLRTGQVAIRRDALKEPDIRIVNTCAHHFTRIRAVDGLRLLTRYPHVYFPTTDDYEPAIALPEWFFVTSDEHQDVLVKVIRKIRLKALLGRIGAKITSGISITLRSLGSLIGKFLAVAFFGFMVYIVVRILKVVT